MTEASRPVRVLWLIKGLGPGGAERLLVHQAAVADPAVVSVRCAYLVPWKDRLVPDLEAHGVPTRCLDGAREWDLRWALRLRRLLVADPVDVVHVHSPYVASVARLVVRTLPRATRPALLATEHNRWPRHKPATRWFNRATGRLDDAIIAVSDDVRSTMPAARRAHVEVLRHGIDLTAVDTRRLAPDAVDRRAALRTELGLADTTVAVTCVANLRGEKGHDVLLDAAARLTADHPADEVTLLLAGQGPLADELAATHARLGLGEAVRLLGERQDVLDLLFASDVFCLASRHEGLPVALMEALAVGLPVVATSVGGVPELVDDGVEGLLVPSDDPAALAAALGRMVDEPATRGAMAAAARRRGATVGIEPAARRLEQRYVELRAARRSRRS